MIDLHCHILPRIDDGPKSLDEALTLARFYLADGITHVVATPHCHGGLRLLRADILPRVVEFQSALDTNQIPLTVFPGSEIQLSETAAYRRDYEAGLFCHLGDRPRFSLLEFAWHGRLYPEDAPQHIAWMLQRGTTPILAHPERFRFFFHNPIWLQALVDAGAWLQITVDSLLGKNGEIAQQAGLAYLQQHPRAVLATDAHGAHRCSGLSVGFELVEEKLGAQKAAELRANADEVLEALVD